MVNKKARTEKQLENDKRLADLARARRGQTNDRGSREQDRRANSKVHDTDSTPWVQGGSLVAPPPRPGYVQRWIRVSTKGKEDPTNVTRKFREGWKPRPADTLPAEYQEAKISQGRFAGFIGVEGMMLCELPVSKKKSRDKFIRNLIDKKTKAIDADLARANKANRGPGFGEIQKSARTIPVREVRAQTEDSEEADA